MAKVAAISRISALFAADLALDSTWVFAAAAPATLALTKGANPRYKPRKFACRSHE
jgi:hypothetical protein